MQDVKTEVITFFTKWWTYFCYILIGLLGQASYDMVHGNKMSWKKRIGKAFIACFIGYIATIVCLKNFPSEAPFIVPITTLLSDKIILYVMTRDWNIAFSQISEWFTKKNNL